MDDHSLLHIEQKLFTLRRGNGKFDNEFTLELVIENVGSWIIKSRKNGLLVNDRELINDDCTRLQGSLIFDSPDTFWNIVNSDDMNISQSNVPGVRLQGDTEIVQKLLLLLSSQMSFTKADIVSSSNKKLNKISSPTLSPPSTSGPGPMSPPGTSGRPIRKGWLHKKRDIISGWRHRYFVVYTGRVEYFIDSTSVVPRGVFPLQGAEVTGPRRCSVNNSDDHWCLILEPRHKDKAITLSSELHGEEGMMDIVSWIQAFNLASRSPDAPTGLPPVSKTQISKSLQSAGVRYNGNISTDPSNSNSSGTVNASISKVSNPVSSELKNAKESVNNSEGSETSSATATFISSVKKGFMNHIGVILAVIVCVLAVGYSFKGLSGVYLSLFVMTVMFAVQIYFVFMNRQQLQV